MHSEEGDGLVEVMTLVAFTKGTDAHPLSCLSGQGFSACQSASCDLGYIP